MSKGRTPRPEPVSIPLWSQDKAGGIVARRTAQFWHSTGKGNIECLLCYRRCTLTPGKAGWCGFRGNERGAMALSAHGVLSKAQRQIMGYGGGQRCYLPGGFGLGIGGTHCTARCSFCTSAEIVWRPDAIPWQGGRERGMGTSGGWYYGAKAMLHPSGVLQMARQCAADALVFAENEPLLSFEYTLDCARLAKQAGIKVVLYTNGFSTPAVIQKLAPYVDSVDLGIKGSLDPVFYDRWMKAPGGAEAVKASLLAWKQAGVHLLISDLVATPVMQTDAVMVEAQQRLYAWIADELGEHTPILQAVMHTPENVQPPQPLLVKKPSTSTVGRQPTSVPDPADCIMLTWRSTRC
jgi:pyruvate formate lyase activating enzyme